MSVLSLTSRARPRASVTTVLAAAGTVVGLGVIGGRLAISHYGLTAVKLTAGLLALALVTSVITRKPPLGVASIVAGLVLIPSYKAPTVQHLLLDPALVLSAIVALLFFLSTVAARRTRISAVDVCVIALVVAMLVAMLAGPRSFKDALAQWWLWLPPYLAGRVIGSRRPLNRVFAVSVVAGGLFLAPFAVVEALGLGSPFFSAANANNPNANIWDQPHLRAGSGFRVQTSWGHPIAYSMFLAAAIVFAIVLLATAKDVRQRRLYLLATAVLLLCEALTLSRSGWVVIGIAIVILAADRGRHAASRMARRAILAGVCGLVALALAVPSVAAIPLSLVGLQSDTSSNAALQLSSSYRVGLYSTAFQSGVASWFGNRTSKLADTVESTNNSIDSEYLVLLDSWGAPVTIAFLLLIGAVAIRALSAAGEPDDEWSRVYAATATALGVSLASVALITQQEYFVWFMFGLAAVPRAGQPLFGIRGENGRWHFAEPGVAQSAIAKTNAALILPAIRRWWWIAAAGAAVGGALTAAIPRVSPTKYTAASAVLFQTPHFDQILFGHSLLPSTDQTDTASQLQDDGQREAATNLGELKLAVLDADTSAALRGELTPKQVAQQIQVSEVNQSDVYNIKSTASNPQLARALVATYQREFLLVAAQDSRKGIQAEINGVDAQLSAMTPAERRSQSAVSLSGSLRNLAVVASLETGNVESIAAASSAPVATAAVKKRTVLYGMLIGLGAALILVTYLARRDRRLTDIGALEEAFAAPVLGTVPRISGHGHREGDPASFGMVRTRLRYFNVDRRIDSLLVTSANRGDGRTTAAYELAVAEARAGNPAVLLIEADLRHPTLRSISGGVVRPGLVEVLSRLVPLEDAIHELDVSDEGQEARISLLLAGAPAPNPARLLGSDAMEELLQTLRRQFDLVIIDSPPVSAVPDAIRLMKAVAGVVVITRLAEIKRDQARALHERLVSLDAHVLGVIVNERSRPRSRATRLRAALRRSA